MRTEKSKTHWKRVMVFFVIISLSVILFMKTNNSSVSCNESSPLCHRLTIVGQSMSPTLRDGEKVWLDTRYYSGHPIERGDVVVFRFGQTNPSNVQRVKRVIAIQGDSFGFDSQNQLVINGQRLVEPYAIGAMPAFKRVILRQVMEAWKGKVPPHRVIVLGDNRLDSYDSGNFGLLAEEFILGKVEMPHASS